MEVRRMTAQSLVNRLRSVSEDTQKQAARELRLLARRDDENRGCIAGAGAVPSLIELLYSTDTELQVNCITALLNLSIYGPNKEAIMSTRGALDAIVHVLKLGQSMEAKQNSAAVIFSLNTVENYRAIFGDRPAVVRGLLDLIRMGNPKCTKDALKALFHLALHPLNRSKMVSAGVVAVLFSLVMNSSMGLVEDATAVLAQIAACSESAQGFQKVFGVQVLLDLLDTGSPRAQENVASALLNLVQCGGECVVADILDTETAVTLLSDLLDTGTPRCKSKVSSLLKLLGARERRPMSAAF